MLHLKKGFHQLMIEKRRPLVLVTGAEEPIYIKADVPAGSGYPAELKSKGLLLLNWLQHTMMSLCHFKAILLFSPKKASKRYW